MQFTNKQILEFQTLYKQEFGEDISYKEAYSQFTDLMILGGIIYSPMAKQDLIALDNFHKYGAFKKSIK